MLLILCFFCLILFFSAGIFWSNCNLLLLFLIFVNFSMRTLSIIDKCANHWNMLVPITLYHWNKLNIKNFKKNEDWKTNVSFIDRISRVNYWQEIIGTSSVLRFCVEVLNVVRSNTFINFLSINLSLAKECQWMCQ